LLSGSKCDTDSQEVSNVSGIGDTDMCIMCMVKPKNGIFVHRKIGHIYCCYKCALKTWVEGGRCPVCNCKVNSVLKAVGL
jgi:E3 ubiquitin-protein ligase Mdm2